MTYLLIAYFLVGGAWHSEVADSGLTAEDCAYVLKAYSTPEHPLGCELEMPEVDE